MRRPLQPVAEPAGAKTIFDFGVHEGDDSDFYLRKGFRVVALEANPDLYPGLARRFGDAIRAGRWLLVRKALASRSGSSIPFYVRADKNGFSSIEIASAERDGIASRRVDVPTVTLGDLIGEFGLPYYLKCDIDGAEHIVLRQLVAELVKPPFVSFELGATTIDDLVEAGYTRFQIVNQSYLRLFRPPSPALEGQYTPQVFDGRMSGLFGKELDPRHWVDEGEIRRRLQTWARLSSGEITGLRRYALRKLGKLTKRTWLIHPGWIDIHARLDP